MRKIFVTWLCEIMIFAAAISNVHAQEARPDNLYASVKSQAALVDDNTAPNDRVVDETPLNDAKAKLKALKIALKARKANAKAQSYFSKVCGNVAGASWTAETNVITASYTKDNVNTRVVFTKNGAWLHTMMYYKADNVKGDIRVLVERSYPGYKITGMREIKEADTFYVVYLEDQDSYKQVVVKDGEVGTYMQFKKSQ